MIMEYNVVDVKNKIIKIECEKEDCLNGKLDEYIKCALRQQANKIIVEIMNMGYTEKELNNMFSIFLEESGFYDCEWHYGIGNLKKDVLIWKCGTSHQDILNWFDNNFENGLNDYIKRNWEFWMDEEDICIDCPKLIDCGSCTF